MVQVDISQLSGECNVWREKLQFVLLAHQRGIEQVVIVVLNSQSFEQPFQHGGRAGRLRFGQLAEGIAHGVRSISWG